MPMKKKLYKTGILIQLKMFYEYLFKIFVDVSEM